jgi:hypothetical protein
MATRASLRSRHRVVEREDRSQPMHASQFRSPDAIEGELENSESEDVEEDEEAQSLGNGFVSSSSFNSTLSRRRRTWNALPMKTKVLGPGLLVVGACMLFTRMAFALGAIDLPRDAERGTSTALTVVGSMCALAGGYSTLVMIMVWRGEPGWSYSMIPGYDEPFYET